MTRPGPQFDPPVETGAGADQPPLVLAVDDSALQRKIVVSSLKRWGYRVVEAASGEEAVQVCRNTPPDLVLSDWMMPGMDGLEFCQAFRAMDRDTYGYFILLTSKSEKDEVARGLESGADDFLTKPVNPVELRARLTAGERVLKMERQLTEKNRVITAALAEIQTLYQALDSDLIEARKLQQSLVRERFKEFETANLSLLLRPSGHVGGDLVGFFPAGENKVGLFAIDVSGHGISSALMTARLAGYLSSATPDQNLALTTGRGGSIKTRPLPEVVSSLNSVVLNEMETEHYFTLVLAYGDLTTGELNMVQAGHPHPVIQRADGAIDHVGCGGLPVGLVPDAAYESFRVTLLPGDRLLILSDGVTECTDPKGDMLGEAGLDTLLKRSAAMQGPQMLEALVWDLSSFADGEDFEDDVSGLLLEYHGPKAT